MRGPNPLGLGYPVRIFRPSGESGPQDPPGSLARPVRLDRVAEHVIGREVVAREEDPPLRRRLARRGAAPVFDGGAPWDDIGEGGADNEAAGGTLCDGTATGSCSAAWAVPRTSPVRSRRHQEPRSARHSSSSSGASLVDGHGHMTRGEGRTFTSNDGVADASSPDPCPGTSTVRGHVERRLVARQVACAVPWDRVATDVEPPTKVR